MHRFILFLALFFTLCFSAQKQNYQWFKIKKYKIANLSDELKETSGLNFFNGKLYTFNDGGNTSELFEIDKTSGKILNKITTNLINFDWEALTSDDQHFYIGDFGNNWGLRKDLKIYVLHKNEEQKVLSLPFQYPEQQEFVKKPQSNNWDAESMVFKDGNLHVFTKEWESYQTSHYQINPAISEGIQNAEKLETYNLGYLATDASYFGKQLYIIGYTKKMEVYLTIFQEDENGLFFTKKPTKYYLGSSSKLGQVEGIAVNSDGIYISAEEFNYKIFHAKPAFYFIPFDDLK